jgi:uncharacterized protein YjbJ (UPF0337 family)
MITRQELEGQWNEVKGQIQERWGGLTDDELLQARGNTNQLIGLIQQRTGEARSAIEEFLDQAVHSGGAAVQQAMDKAKDYAQQARHAAREYGDQAREAARRGYEQVSAGVNTGVHEAQEMVRRNPLESIGVAFGAGLIAGIITGLVLKSSR